MVKSKILYTCPLCNRTFDTESQCEQHVEEHAVKDYYGIWRRIEGNVPEWFVPGGYILLNDGKYIVSGVQITKTTDDVLIRSSHFPLESVQCMPCSDINELFEYMKESILTKIMECRSETYAEWCARREKK